MSILEYWNAIYKRLWLVAILVVGTVGAVAYYTHDEEKLYSTHATVLINMSAINPIQPIYQLDEYALSSMFVEFMEEGPFALYVAQEMPAPLEKEEILDAVNVKLVSNNRHIQITATYNNPQIAADIANAAAQVFVAEIAAQLQVKQKQEIAGLTPSQDHEQVAQMQQVLQQELAYINNQITTVQNEIADLQGQPRSSRLNQRVQNLLAQLFELRRLRADVLSSMPTSLLTPALPPTEPLPSNRNKQLLQAFAAALITGAAIAIMWEFWSPGIRSIHHLEATYGLPILGTLGNFVKTRWDTWRFVQQSIIAPGDPTAPHAGAFHTLLVSMRVAGVGATLHSLLMTSAAPGEGKTFCAVHLAASLARSGSRVILVDANFERPAVHNMLDLQQSPGFIDLLNNPQQPIHDVLQYADGIEHLSVLSYGASLPETVSLLTSPRMLTLMEQLEQLADIVIYDAPPLATIHDAAFLASRVDTVIQVVDANRTRIGQIQQCKAVLERVRANILGPVLNRATTGTARSQGQVARSTYEHNKLLPKNSASHQKQALVHAQSPSNGKDNNTNNHSSRSFRKPEVDIHKHT